MDSLKRMKIGLLSLILILPAGCLSRYYRQNPVNEHVLRRNNNPVQEIRLFNKTDTNLYYHFNSSVSGATPLFGDQNEFIRNFRFEELSTKREIVLQIKKGEILKIRYKKNKSEVEEKYLVDISKKIEVSTEGVTFFNK